MNEKEYGDIFSIFIEAQIPSQMCNTNLHRLLGPKKGKKKEGTFLAPSLFQLPPHHSSETAHAKGKERKKERYYLGLRHLR